LYIYQPLPPADSIRLFNLLAGDPEAPLEGNLAAVSLSDSTLSFKALSYTWGNPIDDDSQFNKSYNIVKLYVICNKKKLAITENLQDALWQLCQLDQFLSLWVDAICINQNNPDEKIQQITLSYIPTISIVADRITKLLDQIAF
jgi:hypothetical protein